MPGENKSYADALTALNAPPAHPAQIVVSDKVAESAAKSVGYNPSTGPRSPIMHFTEPPPFFRNSETSIVTGETPRSRS